MKKRDELKILLMQIRGDEATLEEEFLSFVQFSELREEQFDPINVYTTHDFDNTLINNYDALFIGGSSDATVRDEETYHFIPACKVLIRHCYQNNIPVLASCFGFQLAVKEMGSQVVLDKENMELGIHKIQLTAEAKTDKLLAGYPSEFYVVSGHQERADATPDSAVLLAKSDKCDYHLIKFKNKPFYCFQFHPEVNRSVFLARAARYQDKYLDTENELQEVIESATHETPWSNKLVKDFIDRIILNTPPVTSTDKREHIPDTMTK